MDRPLVVTLQPPLYFYNYFNYFNNNYNSFTDYYNYKLNIS